MNRLWLWITAGLLLAGMALTALAPMDRASTFSAVLEAWADVWQDAGQSTGRVLRRSTAAEIALGQRLAAEVERGQHMPADLTAYVSAVGQRLVQGAHRQDLRWRFRVIDSPAVNAFALPGGSVYLYKGLFDRLHDESQLAALLGHEIAHADLYHCADRFSPGGLIAFTYGQQQEFDADARGFALAVEAAYDPAGAASLMALLDEMAPPPSVRAPASPAGELAGAAGQALSDYFRTHPRSAERRSRLRALAVAAPQDRTYCTGAVNLRERTPCPAPARSR